MTTRKVGVLIVEDSPTAQHLLTYLINGDERLHVVGVAETAERGLDLIRRLTPDVVSLDVHLPGMDGLEATRRIMKDHPLPIVVVSDRVNDRSLQISMNALRAGALAVVQKPGAPGSIDFAEHAERLCTQLYIMSQVRVIRQRTVSPVRPLTPAPAPSPTSGYDVVGLVASTGGPPALVKVLRGLSPSYPMPVLIVQHMGADFMAGFAAWLGSVCPMTVEVARAGVIPQPGHVYVAPGDLHLTADRSALRLSNGAPECGQRPAGDVLLRSLAENFGGSAIGVVLTGMGEDGARGLLHLRQAGGYTIAESPASAVIYGMPGAAAEMGAAAEQLTLDAIGSRLAELAARRRSPP